MDEKMEDEIVMTDGLWKLLTRNEIDVEEDDEIMYQELAYDYGLMFKSSGAQRNSRSKKWTHILSKSSHLQPKDVVVQKSKFTSNGKERISSDPGGASSSSASTSRAIPIISSKKTATRLIKRRNTIHSPILTNSKKKLREEQERIIHENAQNIEGDVFRTPDATLNNSRMDISYGSGLQRKKFLPAIFEKKESKPKPSANQKNNYIYLPDNDNLLIEKFKTYLSALHAGHNIDFNEAHQIAARLLQKKLLTKKQYTNFISKI